jgi:hypothetical protein
MEQGPGRVGCRGQAPSLAHASAATKYQSSFHI